MIIIIKLPGLEISGWCPAMSHGQVKRSLALVVNHLEMLSRKKYWWLCNLTIHQLIMKMTQKSKSYCLVRRAGIKGRVPH